MRTIYQAENAIDAQLLKDLLDNAGIKSFINGDFLQGGIGEAPTMGLVSVSVIDSDIQAAIKLATEFQARITQDSDSRESDWEPDGQLLDGNN